MRQLRVTARAGLRLPGLGSRPHGGTFDVPDEVADELARLSGLELVGAKKPKREPAAVEMPAPEEVIDNAS